MPPLVKAARSTATSTDESRLTPKGRRTRQQLLDAGRAVLETRGYFDATITEITASSGVALGTFYRYFDNKEALFLQLLEDVVAELADSVSGSWGSEHPLENLRESSRRYLRTYWENRQLISALVEMAAAVPACAARWWDLRMHTYRRMERYLRHAATTSELDTRLTASALGGMVEQFAYHWFIEAARNNKRVPSIQTAAETVSQVWYRAIYKD